MRILVIGSGAREHALVHALAADPAHELHTAPSNPGMALESTQHSVNPLDGAAVAGLATQIGADLVVVGAEAPLVAGVADAVRAAGISCFGPSARAAVLEGSKAFAKEVMAAANVPTAMAHVCTTPTEVASALDAFGPPYVVKDDGLAAGKGVVVTTDRDEAVAHAHRCLAQRGGVVVVEEYLDGPEISLFCLTDGTTVVPLAPAQDFKRALDDDAGPNTGGMGAYSPLPWAPASLVDEVVARVAQPTVDEMRRRGTPFAGVLYCGLAMTSRGLRVVEFNVRFGDPETQVVLARLATPLAPVLHAAATGQLADAARLRWRDEAAVTVVIAAQGYPGDVSSGDEITGIDAAGQVEGVHVLHAGTATDGGRLVSAGGRVLSVVGTGATLDQARQAAYRAVGLIRLPGSHIRTDIALAAAQASGAAPADAARLAPAPITPLHLPGWVHRYSGKVRDLYEPAGPHPLGDVVLVVASDRISAFDHVLPTEIPDKGRVLTQLSLWWFDQLADIVPHHVLSLAVPAEVEGRAMICRRLEMFPVECVARGYLTGSGLAAYRENGEVCAVPLPTGLVDGSRLPEAIFTPATKAALGEHDENVSLDVVRAEIGDVADTLRDLTLAIYARAEAIARGRGVILADTKLEFGVVDGQVVLGDEVLTPDSSRFWPAAEWTPGAAQPSFDKQFVRDWLATSWDRTGAPPALPDDVVQRTRARYLEAFERLTGTPFV